MAEVQIQDGNDGVLGYTDLVNGAVNARVYFDPAEFMPNSRANSGTFNVSVGADTMSGKRDYTVTVTEKRVEQVMKSLQKRKMANRLPSLMTQMKVVITLMLPALKPRQAVRILPSPRNLIPTVMRLWRMLKTPQPVYKVLK
ncbi:hypothetical protein INT80_09155 [Gallibacterium anatis]|uniref:Uncharacterized protein n=1 Tax=Gallibacterium anatis TaxID=750 RepID=A0A930URN5_9PAST|nr:hypothetical protein [Gallibacterium anatis]